MITCDQGEMENYAPKSDFLIAILNDEIPLSGSSMAAENLRLLLSMVHDEDQANRDWAAMLIAQLEDDSPAIRAALVHALQDEHRDTRAEALIGMARRDPAMAVPIIKAELKEQIAVSHAWSTTLEAAEETGSAELLPLLRQIAEWPEDEADGIFRMHLDWALTACGGVEPAG